FAHAGVAGGIGLDEHAAPGLREHVGHGAQRCIQAGVLVPADQGDDREVHGGKRIGTIRKRRIRRLYGAAYSSWGGPAPKSARFLKVSLQYLVWMTAHAHC